MQLTPALRSGSAALMQGWLKLRCWVMAAPMPAPLLGQCCDRRRPRFLAHALEQQLAEQRLAEATVVDWQWDSGTGQVHGLLWSGRRLERFHWIPGLQRLVVQPVLELSTRTLHLQLVP
jgi:hypothetical protein